MRAGQARFLPATTTNLMKRRRTLSAPRRWFRTPPCDASCSQAARPKKSPGAFGSARRSPNTASKSRIFGPLTKVLLPRRLSTYNQRRWDRSSASRPFFMASATQTPATGLSTVDKLRMLLDITKTISRSLDLQEVVNLVMDTLDSLIPYDAAGIYLVKCSRPFAEWEGGPDETCVFHTEA